MLLVVKLDDFGDDALEKVKKKLVLSALKLKDYHIKGTAHFLGVSERVISLWVKEWGINVAELRATANASSDGCTVSRRKDLLKLNNDRPLIQEIPT